MPEEKKDTLVDFLTRLYSVYVDLHFAYLEINPLVCLDGVNGKPPTIQYLDMAAKLDQVGSRYLIRQFYYLYLASPCPCSSSDITCFLLVAYVYALASSSFFLCPGH